MAPPTFPSSAPVTITKGGVTSTYNSWAIVGSGVRVLPNGAVPLQVTFRMMGVDSNNNPIELLGQDVVYRVPDILSDSNLSPSALAFFTALATEAMSNGKIA